ncbi:MAG: DUF444 family protein, partial [Alphaproteobacteria bacterium]|nr:DUF444 family protein [Alphaproteobacteria bacterium]
MAMHHFIDRRRNPSDRSLGNRQRFIRRARSQIKEALNKSLRERKLGDVDSGEVLSIPTKGIAEPRLRSNSNEGRRDRVLPGNKEFVTGDQLKKPAKGGQGAGKEGSEDGEAEDEFRFTLSRDEFLEMFFEDLELPDLIKTDLRETTAVAYRRAGFARDGTPSNMDVMRTMRNSLGRRIALHRPDKEAVAALQDEITALEEKTEPVAEDRKRLDGLYEELEALQRRQKVVGYIDPVDVRFRQRTAVPLPNTQAVMFCLMDVSGSPGEGGEGLGHRFFSLFVFFRPRRDSA